MSHGFAPSATSTFGPQIVVAKSVPTVDVVGWRCGDAMRGASRTTLIATITAAAPHVAAVA
jgi:hypothetical protein